LANVEKAFWMIGVALEWTTSQQTIKRQNLILAISVAIGATYLIATIINLWFWP